MALLTNCNPTDTEIAFKEETEETNEDSVIVTTPTRTALRTFMFGHSLIVHDPPAIPTPSNETTVPHWMHILSAEAGLEFAASGQYGFLPQHDNLPPISQWGFDEVTSAWDSDTQTFAEADFNTILLTAANFIQYQSATEVYYGDEDGTTPVSATASIVDWCTDQDTDMVVYIYENWPDMAPFIAGDFPPTEGELEKYYECTSGDFHDWWLHYHDQVMAQTPNTQVRMIPVGPILAKLLTETELSGIPVEELYEDNAPHGRATLYFLAGLITYSAMYGTSPPAGFEVPEIVHSLVREHYVEVSNSIWLELDAFTDIEGNSRIW